MAGQFVTVNTEYGPVKGIIKSSILGADYANFQAIPYMKAPIGKLRFKDPQPPEKWTEPLDATKEGSSFLALNELSLKIEGKLEALYVNVYSKNINPKNPLPVMVFIHGGGYMYGSGGTEFYGPDFFLQKNIVLVTMNYRLGAFGFLSLADESLGVPGNAGLKDQTFALKWVKNNIQNFGGDPNNITIFGESAGGGSVHFHTISEHSKGLFNRAIPMSGTAHCKTFNNLPRHDMALRLAKLVGWDSNGGEAEALAFLEEADAEAIVDASEKLLTDEEKYDQHLMFPFGPTIEPYITENCFVPKDPVLMAQEAWGNEIDIMIGGCSNEGLLVSFLINLSKWDGKSLRENFYNKLPTELSIEINSEKSLEYGKMIKKFYYGCTKPSEMNLQGYYYFFGDVHFWHGIARSVQARVNSSKKGRTFLYRFNVDASFNKFKLIDPSIANFPGSTHGDDLSYLFTSVFGVDTSLESKEFQIIKSMVDIWTNFAITGNPNNSNYINGSWKPVDKPELPLKGLSINTDCFEFEEIPENERIAMWNSIYQKENCQLY